MEAGIFVIFCLLAGVSAIGDQSSGLMQRSFSAISPETSSSGLLRLRGGGRGKQAVVEKPAGTPIISPLVSLILSPNLLLAAVAYGIYRGVDEYQTAQKSVSVPEPEVKPGCLGCFGL
mmetsp:Transcript_42593/g.66715  ORF Transcript_42593/g.66715 Transcript_42593/m.66715 type:complete len:118 (-) Transcript_42593:417-770(-)